MPLTPNSSTSSYVTPEEFLLRKDIRPASMLVLDTGLAATEVQLQTNAVLLAILKESSGIVESAATAGAKYSALDIAAQVAAGTACGEMIKGYISDIAAHRLAERRWQTNQDTLEGYKAALEFLKRLRDGELVLPFAEVATASVPSNSDYTQSELNDLNLVSRNTRVFGVRGSWGQRRS